MANSNSSQSVGGDTSTDDPTFLNNAPAENGSKLAGSALVQTVADIAQVFKHKRIIVELKH